jgi:hypothetical protein
MTTIANDRKTPSMHPVAFWGVGGVLLLLASALYRLTPRALTLFGDVEVAPWQWGLTALWVVFMAWSEGYKGFQKAFSPRVVARSFHLPTLKSPLLFVLAPAFAMGLIHARKGRQIVSWVLLTFIVVLVITVRFLPAPWRAMVDAGVVVGLLWGAISILVIFARALGGKVPGVPLDMPGDPAPPRRRRGKRTP